jgi:hypothetical protein
MAYNASKLFLTLIAFHLRVGSSLACDIKMDAHPAVPHHRFLVKQNDLMTSEGLWDCKFGLLPYHCRFGHGRSILTRNEEQCDRGNYLLKSHHRQPTTKNNLQH